MPLLASFQQNTKAKHPGSFLLRGVTRPEHAIIYPRCLSSKSIKRIIFISSQAWGINFILLKLVVFIEKWTHCFLQICRQG